MNLTITDIGFIIFATIFIVWLIWELIPESAKKYWKYGRMVKKDRKLGQKRKYIFSFRNGTGQIRTKETK